MMEYLSRYLNLSTVKYGIQKGQKIQMIPLKEISSEKCSSGSTN